MISRAEETRVLAERMTDQTTKRMMLVQLWTAIGLPSERACAPSKSFS